MYLTLLFLFAIFYFILTRIRLDWAVMLIIVALPGYMIRFNIEGLPFTILEAMILIAFFSWFIFDTNFKNFIKGKYKVKDFFENRKKRLAYPFGVEMVLFLMIAFIAAAVAGFTSSSLGIWKAYFFEPLLLFILIINVFQKEKGVKKIIFSLAVSALLVSAIAIVQKFTGLWIFNLSWQAEETRRVVSFFGYPNAVGLFLAPIMLILIGQLFKSFKEEKHVENIFLLITILLTFLSIYFAKSEGALAAVFVALTFFGLLANKKWRIITICFIALFIGLIFSDPILKNYTVKKATLMDFSGQVRKAQWSETWRMLKEGRIIQGSGLTGYQTAIEQYHIPGIFYNDGTDPEFHRHTVFNEEYRKSVWRPVEIYLYPHNIILNFWTEMGLAGLLLFIWIVVKFFITIIQNSKFKIQNSTYQNNYPLMLGLGCSMLVILIHGVVDVPYFKNDLACIFWIMIAIVSLISLRMKKTKEENKKTPC